MGFWLVTFSLESNLWVQLLSTNSLCSTKTFQKARSSELVATATATARFQHHHVLKYRMFSTTPLATAIAVDVAANSDPESLLGRGVLALKRAVGLFLSCQTMFSTHHLNLSSVKKLS